MLGGIGKETFEHWASNLDQGEPQLLAYNTFDTVVHGTIPIRWEIGFCHLPGALGRQLLVGQNFSPALLPDRMADTVLASAGWQFSASEHIGLLLHRITPARHTVDFGKTIPAIYQSEAAFVVAALQKLGAGWIKYRKRQIARQESGTAERAQARAHDDQGSGRSLPARGLSDHQQQRALSDQSATDLLSPAPEDPEAHGQG